MLFMSRFDYTIRHAAGKTMTRADALSRRPDHGEGKDDNEDQIVLPQDVFISALRTGVQAPESDIQADLIAEANRFEKSRDLIDALRKQAPSFVDKGLDGWSLDENGLLIYRGRIYVAKFDEIRGRWYDRYTKTQHMDTPESGAPWSSYNENTSGPAWSHSFGNSSRDAQRAKP